MDIAGKRQSSRLMIQRWDEAPMKMTRRVAVKAGLVTAVSALSRSALRADEQKYQGKEGIVPMSHRLDTPLAAQNGQLYIDDLYVFSGADSTVFIMDVNSNITGVHVKPGFHHEARYAPPRVGRRSHWPARRSGLPARVRPSPSPRAPPCRRREGPQTVTERGERAAVILSAADYDALICNRPSLVDHLLSGPAWDDALADAIDAWAKSPSRDTV
jgi:hypothetical protein